MQVSWEQVLAWRLGRGFLDPRTDLTAGDVAGRLCGVQAQVASSAELAVGLRQHDPVVGRVGQGLVDGSLMKTWVMRGTLHVLPTHDAPSYLSLMASTRSWEKGAWQRAFGPSAAQMAALTDLVAEILDGCSLTRDDLVARIVAEEGFAQMEAQLRSGWGTVLKPLAWQGALCFGQSEGRNVTFTNPASALPGWQALPEPDVAAPLVIGAYLGAYGPATPERFDAWLTGGNSRKATLRGWFADLGERLVQIDVEGSTSYLLAEHVDELAAIEPSNTMRLLGGFDQYVLGTGTKSTEMLPSKHRSKVSRAAGWISPVVVSGGRIIGVWDRVEDEVSVSLFPEVEPPPSEALEAEAAQVAKAVGVDRLKVSIV